MNVITRLALALTIIGAINWGLIGLFNFDLVATIFGGQDSLAARIVYSLVGLAGLVCLPLLFMNTDEDDLEMKEDIKGERVRNKNFKYQTEVAEEVDFSDVDVKKRESDQQK